MAYRDDRQALELQLAELERENEELRTELEKARAKAQAARAEDRKRRHDSAMRLCTMCGGALLPVAVFAGRNDRSPLPLRMSTMRFTNPAGGFTSSAPIRAKACSSCGFIHHFIDMLRAKDELQSSWAAMTLPAEEVDDPGEPEQPDDGEPDDG